MIQESLREIVREVPYINERLVEVEVFKEKIVPIQTVVEQIKTATQIV